MKTVHENEQLKVEDNGSGELFVTNKRNGVRIRITPGEYGLTLICAFDRWIPWSVNGLPAMRVENPKGNKYESQS